MSMLEEMGIALILAALRTFVKNPAKKVAMQGHLLNLADEIQAEYAVGTPSAS